MMHNKYNTYMQTQCPYLVEYDWHLHGLSVGFMSFKDDGLETTMTENEAILLKWKVTVFYCIFHHKNAPEWIYPGLIAVNHSFFCDFSNIVNYKILSWRNFFND